jgi:hypothetical protein
MKLNFQSTQYRKFKKKLFLKKIKLVKPMNRVNMPYLQIGAWIF